MKKDLFKLIGISSLIFHFTLTTPLYAQCKAGPIRVTESNLDSFHRVLETVKELCGRFPTSEDGLTSFASNSTKWACLNGHPARDDWKTSEPFKSARDGWGKKLRYSSDGKSYRIEASHGYFVTERSRLQSGGYWESPKPLPPDEEKECDDTIPPQ
jgi:hypothetical protein